MAIQRMEGEDQEALFSSYHCSALYYVQSPSTASHANSLLSPFPHENLNPNRNKEASRFTLSRYSSSRGSNNSFLHEKKIPYDLQSHDSILKSGKLRIVRRIGEDVGGDDDEDETDRNGAWRYFALDPSSSCCCIALQVLWRFLVSVGVALLVFFLVTKPPSPKVSFKVHSDDSSRIEIKLSGCVEPDQVDVSSPRRVHSGSGWLIRPKTPYPFPQWYLH